MKKAKILKNAACMVLVMTIVCGLLYTILITAISQLCFHTKANGSIIEVDGKKYGCELLAQQFTEDKHMWGRIMNVSIFYDKDGTAKLYSGPSNLSPRSAEYQELVDQRVDKILAANPDAKEEKIPVDLVTCSGSGLDPHISVAAAEYQIPRLAEANDMDEDEVRDIIEKCTNHKFLGFLGEETVNVLEVNLMLEGIIE